MNFTYGRRLARGPGGSTVALGEKKKVGSGLVEYQDMRILTLQYICLVHEDIRPKQRLGAKLLFRLHKRLPFGSQMNIQSSQDQDL